MIIILLFIQGVLTYELVAGDFNYQYIDSQFQELQAIHKTHCVQTAITNFILECKAKGADLVDSETRIILAVKLSICEFEETEVAYPESCRNPPVPDNYKRCIQEFRSDAQLWTTYSGNYRKLRSICFEESFPFIKNHIVDLFYNITRIYSDLFHETTEATKKSKSFQDEVDKKFRMILQLLTLSLEQKQKHQVDVEQAFEIFETSMTTGYTQVRTGMERVAEEMFDDFKKFKQQLNLVNDVVVGMASRYAVMDSRFAEQEEQLLRSREEASTKVFQNLVQMGQITEDSIQRSLVLKEDFLNTILIGNQLRHNLQEVSEKVEYWVGHMDNRLSSLYDELSLRLSAKTDLLGGMIELQLQLVVNGTVEFKHQMQKHLANVTDAVIKVETHISTLGLPLLLQGVLGNMRQMALHALVVPQIAVLVSVAVVGFKLHHTIARSISFLLAMIPGFLIAFVLRAVIGAYLL